MRNLLINQLIDESIDERIKKSINGRNPKSSSKGMSNLQRYIKEANNRDNKSIHKSIKERRILCASH